MADQKRCIRLYKHAYAENSYILDHFTGTLLISGEDLQELWRQMDQHLYPNKGFETELDVWPNG